MRVLIIDNNDSFTFNLAQMVEEVKGTNLTVLSYDRINLKKILEFDKIIISPGPGLPGDFQNYKQWIPQLEGKRAILGICMGLEIIADIYGAKLVAMPNVQHGVRKKVQIDQSHWLFKDMDEQIVVGLYHSWKVAHENIPDTLQVISSDSEGNVMGMSHRKFDIIGLQFHPESYISETGKQIIFNWLSC